MAKLNANVKTETKGIRYFKMYTSRDLIFLVSNLIFWNLIVTTTLWITVSSIAGIVALAGFSIFSVVFCASSDNTLSIFDKLFKLCGALVLNRQYNNKHMDFMANIVKIKDNQVILKTKDPYKYIVQNFLVMSHSDIKNLEEAEQEIIINCMQEYFNIFKNEYSLYSFNTTFNVQSNINQIRKMLNEELIKRSDSFNEGKDFVKSDFKCQMADLINLEEYQKDIIENNYVVLSYQELVPLKKDLDEIFNIYPSMPQNFNLGGVSLNFTKPNKYFMNSILEQVFGYDEIDIKRKTKIQIKKHFIKKTTSVQIPTEKKPLVFDDYVAYIKLTKLPNTLVNGYLYDLFHNPSHYSVVLKANEIDESYNNKIQRTVQANLEIKDNKNKSRRSELEIQKQQDNIEQVFQDLVYSGDRFRDMMVLIEIKAQSEEEIHRNVRSFIKQNKSKGFIFNELKWQQYLAMNDFYETKTSNIERGYDNEEVTNWWKKLVQLFKYGKYAPYQISNFNLWMSDGYIATGLPATTSNFIDKNGLYIGTESYSNDDAPVCWDRYDHKYRNQHLINIGVSGSGKTSSTIMMLRKENWYTNSKLILLDPKNEYKPFVLEQNGIVIDIAKGFINPFSLNIRKDVIREQIIKDAASNNIVLPNEEGFEELIQNEILNLISQKIDVLGSFLDILLGLHQDDQKELSTSNILIQIIGENYHENNIKDWNFDYLMQLVQNKQDIFRKTLNSEEYQQLISNILPYTSEGSKKDLFTNKNLDLENKMVSFNFISGQTGISTKSRDAILFQIIVFMNEQMLNNVFGEKRLTILIEEFSLFFQFRQMITLFESLYRIARSYKTGVILNFQEFSLFKNNKAQMSGIMSNANFFNIFNISGENFQDFKEYIADSSISISKFESKAIQSFQNRRSLLISQNTKTIVDWDMEIYFDPSKAQIEDDYETKKLESLQKKIINLGVEMGLWILDTSFDSDVEGIKYENNINDVQTADIEVSE